MNVKINGSIASISETDTFQYNGSTFNFKDVIVNAPAFNNTTVPVCVKVNIDKTDLSNVKVGNAVDIDASIKSVMKTTSTGKTFWNTTLTAWKIQLQGQQVAQQQPVPQQQVQQTVQQSTTPPAKDDDLPF